MGHRAWQVGLLESVMGEGYMVSLERILETEMTAKRYLIHLVLVGGLVAAIRLLVWIHNADKNHSSTTATGDRLAGDGAERR